MQWAVYNAPPIGACADRSSEHRGHRKIAQPKQTASHPTPLASLSPSQTREISKPLHPANPMHAPGWTTTTARHTSNTMGCTLHVPAAPLTWNGRSGGTHRGGWGTHRRAVARGCGRTAVKGPATASTRAPHIATPYPGHVLNALCFAHWAGGACLARVIPRLAGEATYPHLGLACVRMPSRAPLDTMVCRERLYLTSACRRKCLCLSARAAANACLNLPHRARAW